MICPFKALQSVQIVDEVTTIFRINSVGPCNTEGACLYMSKLSGLHIMCASYYSLIGYCTALDKFMSTFLETTYDHTPCNNDII